MPIGKFHTDQTADEWAREIGLAWNALLEATSRINNLKLRWDLFINSRTDAAVAVALGRTVASGTAQSATATTIVLAAGDTALDDDYNGLVCYITEGTSKGSEGTITDYVASTKTATVGSWSSGTPDVTSKYAIADEFVATASLAVADGNKIRRLMLGQVAHTPSSNLDENGRKFT
jgi:hypothetical protein